MLRYFLGLALCCIICMPTTAHSEKWFSIGVEGIDYMPYFNGKGSEYSGFARELLDAFAKRHDYQFQYTALPVRRLYQEFIETRQLDFKFPDNPHWRVDIKKRTNLRYSSPVCDFVDGILVNKKDLGKGITHLKTLGIIFGFDPSRHLEGLDENQVKLAPNTNIQSMARMTLSERINGFYANIAVANAQLKEINAQDDILFDKSLPYRKGSYHLSTIKHPEVLKQFNDFLQQEKQLVDSLKEQYGITDVSD
ncbi:transporter substrate-binding domain-containing protein [Pseudodesulfovibrio sp. zrk46]|uniref:substrate-binding periplasmic protein n=1 Tax=Pseudodesulfovibrio sp. zrk46 TaxID=2725288 RepID=UPI00144917A4|nr:transporter substrate-binding domain-containing protein [Pseudodesulfovibrio sp. zrk46]QJB55823.1 transporter substrate-binding domain-containing protein [Pseudodesulfovibrio sp. zrk46]